MISGIPELHLAALPHTWSSRLGRGYLALLYGLVARLGYVHTISRSGKLVGVISGIGPLILTVAVHPAWQGRGIGRALLALLPGRRYVYTERATVGFYEKMGFVPLRQVGAYTFLRQGEPDPRLTTLGGVVATGVLLAGIYLYGYRQMYFHQDDLDWFLLANRPFWQVMAAPLGDHINYLFRILLSLEWQLFHLSFPGYLLVSVFLHGSVLTVLYLLAYATSGRRDLATAAALLFTVNTNWTEVILWTSGQTISISALFILLSMWALWRKRFVLPSLLLASWTSALALGLPIAAFLTYGFSPGRKRLTRVGWGTLIVLLQVALLYHFLATDGTPLALSSRWVFQVVLVAILAPFHTALGRLILPFDRFEHLRLVLTTIGGFFLAFMRPVWKQILRDTWSRFVFLQLIFYYGIVAVGRAQYGIGIMRAERYAYLGLALILLVLVRMLRKWQPGRWILVVPVIVILQCAGLYTRAQAYVVRPQELRALMSGLVKLDPHRCYRDNYLPHFVLNDERLRYSDLMGLMGTWQFGEQGNCLPLSQ